MKLNLVRIRSFVLIFIMIIVLIAGCSSSEKDSYTGNEADYNDGDISYSQAESSDNATSKGDDYDRGEYTFSEDSLGALNATVSTNSPNDILDQRKVAFNANLTLEVEDYNETYGKIATTINGIGYVQSSNMTKDRVKNNGEYTYVTRGVVVIRVAKSSFNSIINGIQGFGEVIEKAENSQDFTEAYFDTESRLKLLRLQEERLFEYLSKIDNPDTIFKYERNLTDVRHEIESLTGTLRKYDDMVELSTITINIREVKKDDEAAIQSEEDSNYLKRIFDGFISSVKGVVQFSADLLVVIAQAIPVIFLIMLLAAVIYFPTRKLYKNIKKSENND